MRYLLSKAKYDMVTTLRSIRRKTKKNSVLEYPLTIQLPITYLCNFNCVMCGMHHMTRYKDFTAEQLGKILEDKLFSKVEAVGVNGGEPFLKPDILECFHEMIEKLPSLKNFYIISNGYFTERITKNLREIKRMCKPKGIKVNISFSVDGIEDMQDFHRGKKGAFENVEKTIRALWENQEEYIDFMNLTCTITKYNIKRINEVEVWVEKMGIPMAYNIATLNVRIENEDRVESFSLMQDEHARMLAMEFFHKKYMETAEEKYYILYLYLRDGKRYADCPCMYNEWITLTPNGQIGFCATHSKELGSALERSAYEIIRENISHLDEIKQEHCNGCSHYTSMLNAEGYKLLREEMRKNYYVR